MSNRKQTQRSVNTPIFDAYRQTLLREISDAVAAGEQQTERLILSTRELIDLHRERSEPSR